MTYPSILDDKRTNVNRNQEWLKAFNYLRDSMISGVDWTSSREEILISTISQLKVVRDQIENLLSCITKVRIVYENLYISDSMASSHINHQTSFS